MKSALVRPLVQTPENPVIVLSKRQVIAAPIAAVIAGFTLPVLAVDNRTDLLEVDAKNFSRPTIIDNKYMPLKPGMQFVFEGWAIDDEDKKVPRKVIDVITDLVKDINGIETVILWERDIVSGRLEESELAFRAQDDKGNVWHFGEVKEVYDENGKLVGGKVWMQGRLGAKAGIIMPAKPAVGTPSVSQGFATGVYKWDDRGQVRKVSEKVKVPAGAYKDVVVIEEWSSGEKKKGAVQLKYYAPGVGYVKVGFEGDDPVKETLELVKVSELTAKEMDEARAEALLLEERNYYYGRTTQPPKRRPK